MADHLIKESGVRPLLHSFAVEAIMDGNTIKVRTRQKNLFPCFSLFFLTYCGCFVNTKVFYFFTMCRKLTFFHTLPLNSHLDVYLAPVRIESSSNFFQSVRYLFSQFSQAGIVSWKGHKFSTYGLELAQPFLDTIFLLSRTGKKSNSHLEKLFSRQI